MAFFLLSGDILPFVLNDLVSMSFVFSDVVPMSLVLTDIFHIARS